MSRLYVTCLFNFCARLDESQAGIKTAGRNINSIRYADDDILIAESEEELKNILMRVKEKSKKNCLDLNIQKSNIMVSSPITSQRIEREKVEAVSDFVSLGSKITADIDCGHEIKIHLLLGRNAMTSPDRILKKQIYYSLSQGGCTGTILRDGMGREVGGGFRKGDTCTLMTD